MPEKFGKQVMANLPKDHVNEARPFTYVVLISLDHFLLKKDKVN